MGCNYFQSPTHNNVTLACFSANSINWSTLNESTIESSSRINKCRSERLNLGNFKNEYKVLLSISAFCFSSSAALPVCVNPRSHYLGSVRYDHCNGNLYIYEWNISIGFHQKQSLQVEYAEIKFLNTNGNTYGR